MSNDINAIFRDDEILVVLDGHPYVVPDDHDHYDEIVDAIVGVDPDELRNLLQVKAKAKRVANRLEKFDIKLDLETDTVTYKGNPLPMDLSDYLRTAMENDSEMAVVKFIQRLYENPNHRTRRHLFAFMDKNKHPITSDGRFVCYKAVRSDYMDKHSGRVRNAPGAIMRKLDWSQVDTDPNVTCSRGYHACSRAYLERMFYSKGDRVVTVAVAPEDVGAIPMDYDGSKLRARGYEVLADITDVFVKDLSAKQELNRHGEFVTPSSRDERPIGVQERDIWF